MYMEAGCNGEMDRAFVRDASLTLRIILLSAFQNFGRSEDNAFINGTGIEMPTGILNETSRAKLLRPLTISAMMMLSICTSL